MTGIPYFEKRALVSWAVAPRRNTPFRRRRFCITTFRRWTIAVPFHSLVIISKCCECSTGSSGDFPYCCIVFVPNKGVDWWTVHLRFELRYRNGLCGGVTASGAYQELSIFLIYAAVPEGSNYWTCHHLSGLPSNKKRSEAVTCRSAALPFWADSSSDQVSSCRLPKRLAWQYISMRTKSGLQLTTKTFGSHWLFPSSAAVRKPTLLKTVHWKFGGLFSSVSKLSRSQSRSEFTM